VTDKPLHTDEELLTIYDEALDALPDEPQAHLLGILVRLRAVEASTVAKLAAAAGDWQERWFRFLGGVCEHSAPYEGTPENPVCGDCALSLAREAVAEVQAAHEQLLVDIGATTQRAIDTALCERDEWKALAEALAEPNLTKVRALIEAAHAMKSGEHGSKVWERLDAALAAVDHLRERT